MNARVLICDDDPDVRAVMRRTLKRFDVIEASNPREALELLRTCELEAIVSDLSMEGDTDGLDLLQLAKVMYPAMVRFLVTANRELDVALRALNEQSVHRYFLKPWNESVVANALDIAISSRLWLAR